MALIDSVLNLVTKQAKDPNAPSHRQDQDQSVKQN